MTRMKSLGLFTLALAAGAAFAQAAPDTAAPTVVVTVPITGASAGPAMRSLTASADELRHAIQVLAQKAPGPERDLAIAKARAALMQTRQAMRDLPPEYRTAATAPTTGSYGESVQLLMDAADSLRTSVHAMAREPAGPARNQAIRDANRALLQTQVAMANAYEPTAASGATTVMGAGGTAATMVLHCGRLPTMWACR